MTPLFGNKKKLPRNTNRLLIYECMHVLVYFALQSCPNSPLHGLLIPLSMTEKKNQHTTQIYHPHRISFDDYLDSTASNYTCKNFFLIQNRIQFIRNNRSAGVRWKLVFPCVSIGKSDGKVKHPFRQDYRRK